MSEEASPDNTSPAKNNDSIIHVRVKAPYKTYYDGEAMSVSAVNETGVFDILGKHHNFISILSAGDIVIRTLNGEEEKITIQKGVMHVKANEVIVFLDV